MDILNILYRMPTPRIIRGMFLKYLADCATVLDVGCGAESIIYRLGINTVKVTGLDIWEKYAELNRNGRYAGYYQGDILTAQFLPNSFDAILLSDVVEHITKAKVAEADLFNKLARWARKRVIIMTPYGWVDNDSYDGNPYLFHASAWWPEDFEKMGYNTVCTYRIRRKKYPKITRGIEFVKTIFAVKELEGEKILA